MVWPSSSAAPAESWQAGPPPRPPCSRTRIPPAAERQRFDGDRGHAVLNYLDGEVVLVSFFVGAVAAFGVDAHNVVHASPVAGNADHGRMWRRGFQRRQQITEHPH